MLEPIDSAWLPTEAAGCKLRARAGKDSGMNVSCYDDKVNSATNGQTFQVWRDESGNGCDLSQSQASDRGTWQCGVLNSKRVGRNAGTAIHTIDGIHERHRFELRWAIQSVESIGRGPSQGDRLQLGSQLNGSFRPAQLPGQQMRTMRVLAVILAVIPALPLAATDWYVATTGSDATGDGTIDNPWATIAPVNSQATAGDRVYFRGGTYSGYTSVEVVGLTLAGYPGETTIFDGLNTYPIADNLPLVILQYADQTITNVIIQQSRQHGLYLKGPRTRATHIVSRLNQLGGIFITGATSTNAIVEYSLTQSNSMFNVNWIRAYPPYYNASGLTVCRGGVGSTIRHCTNDSVWGEGLSLYETTNITVADSILINASPCLYISDVSGCTFSNLLVHNSWETEFIDPNHLNGVACGIWDEQPGANRSRSNLVINCMFLGGQRCLSVHAGGLSWGLNNVLIRSCIFAYPQGDYNLSVGTGTSNDNALIEDCIFVGAGTNAIANIGTYGGGAITFSHNNWSVLPTPLARGAGDVTGDPLLSRTGPTNAGGLTAAYFKWASSSPARGAGAWSAADLVDFWGYTRANPPSMGAYEYTEPPVISNVGATPASTMVVITWTTDVGATSGIEWGATVSYGSTATNAANVTSHTLTAEPLTPASTIHYRVHSTDPYGNHVASQDATSSTASAPRITANFGGRTVLGGHYQ
jgi:hypothetical protein